MSDDLEPLSPLLSRLVDAERQRPPAPEGEVERVWEKLGVTVGAAALGASAASAAQAASTSTAKAGLAAKLGLSVKLLPWVVLSFAGGAATHAAVTRETPAPTRTEPSPPVTEPHQPPLEQASDTAAEAPEPTPTAPPTAIAAPTPSASVSTSNSPAPGPSGDTSLAAERALVDRARMALARGNWTDAIAATEAHRQRYPRGRLREEREALASQALASGGRSTEARTRAASFRSTYPQSIFSGVVDRVVAP